MVPSGGRGLASGDLDALADRVRDSWTAFVTIADVVDLAAPSRLPGWTGREVLLHLGTWGDRAPLREAVISARTASAGESRHPDEVNAEVIAAHADATDDEVRDALRRSRDEVAAFLADDLEQHAADLASSTLGPLPLAGIVHAGCYELAVHALDLAPCGAPPADPALLDAGLGALIDVTGALAARHGIHVPVSAQTPDGGWRAVVDGELWSTDPRRRRGRCRARRSSAARSTSSTRRPGGSAYRACSCSGASSCRTCRSSSSWRRWSTRCRASRARRCSSAPRRRSAA